MFLGFVWYFIVFVWLRGGFFCPSELEKAVSLLRELDLCLRVLLFLLLLLLWKLQLSRSSSVLKLLTLGKIRIWDIIYSCVYIFPDFIERLGGPVNWG